MLTFAYLPLHFRSPTPSPSFFSVTQCFRWLPPSLRNRITHYALHPQKKIVLAQRGVRGGGLGREGREEKERVEMNKLTNVNNPFFSTNKKKIQGNNRKNLGKPAKMSIRMTDSTNRPRLYWCGKVTARNTDN